LLRIFDLQSIPYLLRLRQCLAEATATKDLPSKRIHYANAVKYVTSLPVIFTGHFMTEWEIASKDPDYRAHEWSHGIVFWIWVTVLICNTAYSLYWDICMDWHLCGNFAILKKPVSILRPTLHFKYPSIYFAAMVINSVLRFGWLLRLWFLGTDPTIALDVTLAIAEIFRRWIWVFFRLEREWVLNIPCPIIYEQVNSESE
jgi:hypothetical protein